MSIYIVTFFIIYFFRILLFTFKRKHFLVILLRLEVSVVALYLGLFYSLSGAEYEFFFSIIFLTIRVCEGALGLSLIVLINRIYSNDLVLSFNSLW